MPLKLIPYLAYQQEVVSSSGFTTVGAQPTLIYIWCIECCCVFDLFTVLVGFGNPTLIFEEGDMSKSAQLLLSVPATQNIAVPVDIEGGREDVNFDSSVLIAANASSGVSYEIWRVVAEP